MAKNTPSILPKKRQEILRWDGWGYKDSRFFIKDDNVYFTSPRYSIGSKKPFTKFRNWVAEHFAIDFSDSPGLSEMPKSYPPPIVNSEFIDALKRMEIDHSFDGPDRLMRSHSQDYHDLCLLREGKIERIADVVVWCTSHEECVKIVNIANEHNVVLIPVGGGTAVTSAISCPKNESRMIVALDTSQMNRMLWIDKENLVAYFEAGIVGQDLNKILKTEGYTMGHEPDSYEFSTLGGWVATRASGMKKNKYGNIEDIVIRVKMVTSKGVLERKISAPRVSSGPDFNNIVMGSEGCLGIVTEVLIKIRPMPTSKKFSSFIFPDFEMGVKFMREVARRQCQPASLRLIDNRQAKMAQTLNSDDGIIFTITDSLKKFLLTNVKGYDANKYSVATVVFEGETNDVNINIKQIDSVAKKFSGISAGSANGQKGYDLTFAIAYMRDLCLERGVVGESFETSVPWDKCLICYESVLSFYEQEFEKLGIKQYIVNGRMTQVYDAGACLYFYFAFKFGSIENPMDVSEGLERKAREIILSCGGSISHHHGIGKLKSKWYKQSVSSVGVKLLQAAKHELDPKNVFAVGNILDPDDQDTTKSHL